MNSKQIPLRMRTRLFMRMGIPNCPAGDNVNLNDDEDYISDIMGYILLFGDDGVAIEHSKIQNRFRRLSLLFHPDKNSGCYEDSNRIFQILENTYHTIKNLLPKHITRLQKILKDPRKKNSSPPRASPRSPPRASPRASPLRASPPRASPLRASPLRASPPRASPPRASPPRSPPRASPPRASPPRASPRSPPRASPRRRSRQIKPCKEGEERNPLNGRCRKKCKEGQERNPLTGRCKKIRRSSSRKPSRSPRQCDLDWFNTERDCIRDTSVPAREVGRRASECGIDIKIYNTRVKRCGKLMELKRNRDAGL